MFQPSSEFSIWVLNYARIFIHRSLISQFFLFSFYSREHCNRNKGRTTTSTREWNDFHSFVLVLVLTSLRRTCKPGRRKHKHKRKERKLKNSDKLSAYILVTHALPFSAMLESSLATKGSPAARLRQISQSVLLRLRMSAYAYAYRTCKHPCAYAWAYACVVRVNQTLSSLLSESAIFHTELG